MSRASSPLSELTRLSPNHSGTRNAKICRLSPHCMAGNLTIESAASWFSKTSTKASSQYGIGTDGRLATFVKETDRSWCTSSSYNDNRAITVEIANDGGGPQWHMSDAAINKFIDLAVDIAQAYGFKRVVYCGSLAKSIEHPDELMITLHRWFANKACPGPYLVDLLPSLVEEMNSRLAGKPARLFSSGSSQRPVLKQPATGEYVKLLQNRLNLHRVTPALEVDGHFGPGTETAVRIFQVSRGLTADGMVGPATWACLDREHDAPVPLPKPVDPITGFTDILDHWAYSNITYLFGRGIVNGTTPTTFEPNAKVTRAAFVKMLHVTSGQPSPVVGDYFGDVKPADWFAPSMYWALNRGIIKGNEQRESKPNDLLSRGEMAVMLNRYLGLPSPTVSETDRYLDDAEIPTWVSDSAYSLKAVGIMSGMVGNRFCARESASRGEAATVLAKALRMN